MSSIQINQFVFPTPMPSAQAVSTVLDTVAGFHAFDERGFPGSGEAYTASTQAWSNAAGSRECKDAYVGHFRFVWVRVAIIQSTERRLATLIKAMFRRPRYSTTDLAASAMHSRKEL